MGVIATTVKKEHSLLFTGTSGEIVDISNGLNKVFDKSTLLNQSVPPTRECVHPSPVEGRLRSGNAMVRV